MKLTVVTIALVATAAVIGVIVARRRTSKDVWETTPGGPYSVIMTDAELACEHPKRKRESVRWSEVVEVQLVTTDEGPFLPDMWYLFISPDGGCSIPSEAKGFDKLFDEFAKRFSGFDFEPIINAGTDNNKYVLWKKE